jgi:3-phosphoshikimate 1-carboxyvinyltransferase
MWSMTIREPAAEVRRVHPPDTAFHATVRVPGDKSLSHRALILAAMASGVSEVSGLGPGADVAATLRAVRSFGVEIRGTRLVSSGITNWTHPPGPVDCGNSGTTMRLLAGALAARSTPTTLVGDASLMRRPMGRLAGPLGSLGAEVTLAGGDTAPLTVVAPRPLVGADVTIPMASAQVRTAFAFAALQAHGVSTVDGPGGFRDHTERWLEAFGLGRWLGDGTAYRIEPGPVPAGHYNLPGDPSSAAFLWASAAIRHGSSVETEDVSLNPGRIGFLQVLEAMGAEVGAEVTRDLGGDPVGRVWVRGRGLRGTDVSGVLTAAALDELPLVAVLGAYAEGMTTVRDAGELRAKESDRIATTVEMIRQLGGGAEATDDGFAVVGMGWLEEGTVDAAGDHRIAMAAAVAATGATGPVTIAGSDAAAVSWPSFFDDVEAMWSSR